MKRIGPRMALIRDFVARNPGRFMHSAAKRVGPHGSTHFGYAAVHRAIAAGLVYSITGAGRTKLYPVVAAVQS